ncbi:enoyl-CoA hydratase/isomerase family protein [Effusibacillus lacus]|uniref:Enoyl-CoA hydratase n=1 Tax=Effusibacillus lacus TaxID=1348429 RepID=A0A292YHY5_9BACL|nr:enoyl-CoA hydratase-related protein [Effusibacillus lacus]TCS74556.1 2-(1,2-epoxy-1,2-dihydrophenyl)acetyl-CoA isomerase [Effusibacillus lacus]GAX88431.1 enoyl-CoA hydratase [Effusibacillus lacus]
MEFLISEKIGKVIHLSLNNPDSRNALHIDMRSQLFAALQDAQSDPEIKAILLTGQGSSFCAGGDVKAMGDSTPRQSMERLQSYNRIISLMKDMDKPIVTAVHGYVFGAGCSLVLASDIVFAAKDTKFSFGFLKIGLMPDAGSTYYLPRLIGVMRAKELIFSGRFFDEEEAYQMGMVTEICESVELFGRALKYAQSLANGPALAIGMAKKALQLSLETGFAGALEFERIGQSLLQQSRDHKEGIRAFQEKRKAEFVGE